MLPQAKYIYVRGNHSVPFQLTVLYALLGLGFEIPHPGIIGLSFPPSIIGLGTPFQCHRVEYPFPVKVRAWSGRIISYHWVIS
jgi:hypothetical protein